MLVKTVYWDIYNKSYFHTTNSLFSIARTQMNGNYSVASNIYSTGLCTVQNSDVITIQSLCRTRHVYTVNDVSICSLYYNESCMDQFLKRKLGPISLTIFPSQFKCDGNFILLSSKYWYSDRYNIWHMARQLGCRGMCQMLLRYDHQ